MSEPRADPAFAAHMDEVVPLWVVTLAVGLCRAYGVPPTAQMVDSIVEESYETAWGLFLAQVGRKDA